MNIRVLFVGEDWHGSNATSCKRAFRALGCDVLNIDDWDFFPQWESFKLKVLRRLLRRTIATEFSAHIERQVRRFQPHLVFIFKGSMLRHHTLQTIRQSGIFVVNFYPDVNLYKHHQFFGNDFLKSVAYYDCIFSPKSYHIEHLVSAGAKRVEFLPYAYDPWCHYPVEILPNEKQIFESDIAFVGTWGKERADILTTLVAKDFHHKFVIWGNQWERLPSDSPLRKFVQFKPANGMTQAKVFQGTKIALAFLSPPDIHTARTFEIPAFGAFMLAERTVEHTSFFEEGCEIACFDDVIELRQKINYYLAHPAERQAIAQAGYEKVTQGNHSYVDRMRRVLDVYHEMTNQQPEVED